MVPDLLNEIHWLIENTGISFIMTGSSARKLRRGHANLLAGRAWRYAMAPLAWIETEGFDLEQVFISGLLPPHFLSPDPVRDLRSYVFCVTPHVSQIQLSIAYWRYYSSHHW